MKRRVVKVETTLGGCTRVLLDDGSELQFVLAADMEFRPFTAGVLVLRLPLVPVEVAGTPMDPKRNPMDGDARTVARG